MSLPTIRKSPSSAMRVLRLSALALVPRASTPEEIADLAVYIAGATYTSGQAFAIDGGWTI